MNFFDIFKNILGIRNRNTHPEPQISDPYGGNPLNRPGPMDDLEDDDDDIRRGHHGMRSFPILTDPIEIHRYFEQQMQEMMKSFSFFSSSPFFEDFPDGNESKMFGAIDQPRERTSELDLRDHYLKKSYDPEGSMRKDMDLDARVNSEGLGKLMDDVAPRNPAIPSPRFKFFGESVVTHTIRKPDGSVETRTTTKRSDGTEETVVSVQKPDGSEDVTTETYEIPRNEPGRFLRKRGDEDFLIDIFKDFFKR